MTRLSAGDLGRIYSATGVATAVPATTPPKRMKALATLPDVSIVGDGALLAAQDLRALREVRVQQKLSVPTLCELVFVDPVGSLADGAALRPGKSLRVDVADQQLFSGQVTAVQHVYEPHGGRVVRVRGYDVLHQLRKRQPVRGHADVNCADLARTLTDGLVSSVEAVEKGPTWQRLVQYRQSDLDLLAEVAERSGLFFALRDGKLHLITLQGTGEEIPLILGESLLEARIEVNGDPTCRTVTTIAWDPSRVEARQGVARDARIGRRTSAEVLPDDVGASGERMLVDEAVRDDAQAEAIAQGELDRRVAREVTLWGVAEGNPLLVPGAIVDVSGVAGPLEGRHVLTSANHTIDVRHGYVCELDTTPPAPRSRPRGAIAAWGVVTSVDDPDGAGRVQVSLPAYNDVQTDWMGVVTSGAGAGKGLICMPDKDDHVLVLFPDGDLSNGLVVGGLYGAKGAPDEAGLEQGVVRRYTFLTPGGQRLQLNDAKKTVRLNNSEGSSIELGPEGAVLHSSVDLTIEAPGKKITLGATEIHFRTMTS